ncbi:glycosyltransferase family 39 protein [Brevundimonas bacteroides]|uniref:glycosyltransferase family 39 protein n=1 Tax=Brevundimonas bacteroides TaxID=74311 RepID=UPI00068D2C36|nr:glycosyltransferase family 39 protein [Brevundimonas bacteroides]
MLLIGAVAALTAIRLTGLQVSVTELHADEAQYWAWAQNPAWGYYSKPPMVAWLIGLAQAVCGTGAACVRAPSVLIWAAIPLLVFGIGATLAGPRVGLWAGILALLAPGAAFSARVMSTDPPLLMFWALALLALVRLRAGGGAAWAAALAVGLGFGLLSKYAMVYWIGGLVLAAVVDPATRRVLRRPALWVGLSGGLALFAPNLIWNLDNALTTVRHTGVNMAGEKGARSLVEVISEGLEFISAQFGLAGPVVFAAVILAAAGWRKLTAEQRLLLAFSMPVFTVVTVAAFAQGANANWAASGLVAAFVLAPTVLAGRVGRAWLGAGLAFCGAVQALLLFGDARADRWVLPGDPYEPVMGWTAVAEAVASRARTEGATVIVAERRGEVANLAHALRETGLAVVAWPPEVEGQPQDHFQMTQPLTVAQAETVLAVATCEDAGRFAGWAEARRMQTVTLPAGAGAVRTLHLFRLSRPTGPVKRPVPCPDA